jgi:hypothetical protein
VAAAALRDGIDSEVLCASLHVAARQPWLVG